MKRIQLIIAIICFVIAGLAFSALVSSAATYDLCVSFDYVDNPMLTDMRNWTASGMNYQETVDDGNGNQIPNPQSKINYIKQNARLFIYRQMFKGYKEDQGQTVLNDFMGLFEGEYAPRVVEGQ